MRKYNTTHLIKSEDLNHHGTLFAARSAAWIVEAAFVAAAIECGNPAETLCRNVHGMEYRVPLDIGDIVGLSSRVVNTGRSSIMVQVEVYSELQDIVVAEAFLTFVIVDNKTGKSRAHNVVLDEPEDEREIMAREKAIRLKERSYGKQS